MNVQEEAFNTEVRELAAKEIDAMSGGGLWTVFITGYIARNIVNDRPWYGSISALCGLARLWCLMVTLMARLGRLQRQVRRAFLSAPGRHFYTAELVAWCYPRLVGPIQRKHRWNVIRACRGVAVRVRRDWPGGVVFRARR